MPAAARNRPRELPEEAVLRAVGITSWAWYVYRAVATRALLCPALFASLLGACTDDDAEPEATSAATSSASTSDDDDDDDGAQTDGNDDDDDDQTGTSDDGDTSTGGQPDGPQWSLTEITYAGPSGEIVLTYDNCTFCDATLNMSTLLVRFQQGDGWTVWSVDIPVGSTTGSQPITSDYSGAYVAINEASPDLPPNYAGYYDPTSASGTLTLTQADIAPGGVVAGTLEVELSQGGIGATLSAEFYAEIPKSLGDRDPAQHR